jgi:hypothetical protein
MKKILFIVIVFICCGSAFSQSLKKYDIGNSGCAAYFYCNPGTFAMEYSEDSAKVYTAECTDTETSYGVICVKLVQKISDINKAEEVVVSYLDYLKTSFKITSSAGYGKGHRLRGKENIHGMIDYWKDAENYNWKVKGWTDGGYIVVLYAYSKKELPETKVNVYLDGIVFPGM